MVEKPTSARPTPPSPCGGVASTSELIKGGARWEDLDRLRDQGALIQLSRGIYRVADAPSQRRSTATATRSPASRKPLRMPSTSRSTTRARRPRSVRSSRRSPASEDISPEAGYAHGSSWTAPTECPASNTWNRQSPLHGTCLGELLSAIYLKRRSVLCCCAKAREKVIDCLKRTLTKLRVRITNCSMCDTVPPPE